MEKLENDQLYKLLFSIKDRPWVFLGQKSLWALENYIAGYLNACSAFDPQCFTIRWHNEFYRYVCDVYHIYKEKYTVFALIRNSGYSDADGLQVYFDFLERFAKEKRNADSDDQPKALQHGEVRAFRIDRSRTADLAGKYIREHSEDFFGIPGIGENGAYVFSISADNALTCMVYSDRSFIKSPDDLSEINDLPVFSDNDLIRYTVITPGRDQMRIEDYLNQHTIVKIGAGLPGYVCCEIIVDDPKELVTVVRESGCCISEIRWWHRTEISLGSSIGYGGPRDPRSPDSHFFAETDICEEFNAILHDEEYYEYFEQVKNMYSGFDLHPAFDIKRL